MYRLSHQVLQCTGYLHQVLHDVQAISIKSCMMYRLSPSSPAWCTGYLHASHSSHIITVIGPLTLTACNPVCLQTRTESGPAPPLVWRPPVLPTWPGLPLAPTPALWPRPPPGDTTPSSSPGQQQRLLLDLQSKEKTSFVMCKTITKRTLMQKLKCRARLQ